MLNTSKGLREVYSYFCLFKDHLGLKINKNDLITKRYMAFYIILADSAKYRCKTSLSEL